RRRHGDSAGWIAHPGADVLHLVGIRQLRAAPRDVVARRRDRAHGTPCAEAHLLVGTADRLPAQPGDLEEPGLLAVRASLWPLHLPADPDAALGLTRCAVLPGFLRCQCIELSDQH